MRRFFIILLFLSTSAVAGEDIDKPWVSVCKGPNNDSYGYCFRSRHESQSDCEKENAYQLSKPRPRGEVNLSGFTTGCIYTGSDAKYILKLKNFGNPAVLCVAKNKNYGGYRVVLVGEPPEDDSYRCD